MMKRMKTNLKVKTKCKLILQLIILKKIKYLLKLSKKETTKKVWKKTKMRKKKVHQTNKKMSKKEKKWERVQLKMSQEQLRAVKSLQNQKQKRF